MKPVRVWAQGFRSYEDFNLVLPGGVVAILGENGAGKSSILSALDVALFGGRGLQRYARRGGDGTMEVGVEFEHGGESYRVRRRVDGAKTTCDLVRDHWDTGTYDTLTGETVAATDDRIVELIGVSRETFRASAFLAQGDAAAFTAARPADRKAILAEILGLGLWEFLADRAKADLIPLERQVAELDARVDMLAPVAEDLETRQAALQGAETAVEQAEGQLAAAVKVRDEKAAQAAKTDAEQGKRNAAEEAAWQAQQHADNLAEYLDEARMRLAEADALIEKKAVVEDTTKQQAEAELILADLSDLAAATRDGKRLAAEDNRLEGLYAVATGETAKARQAETAAMAHTEGTPCPHCKQPMTDTAALEAHRAALAETVEQCVAAEQAAKDAWDAAKAASLDALDVERAAWEKVRKELDDRALAGEGELEQWAREMMASAAQAQKQAWLIEQAEGKRALLAATRERYETEHAQALKAAKDAHAAAMALPDLEPPDDPQPYIAQAQAAQKVRDAAVENRAAAKAALAQAERAAADLAECEHALAELESRAATLRVACKAYGRNGVPALIVETAAVPTIEVRANEVLRALHAPFVVTLETVKALKGSGEQRDTLDIRVWTVDGESAPYEEFSGGERTKLDLALRLALAALLAARKGATVEILAIDEPDYLDAQSMLRLADVLADLAEGTFAHVLLISHFTELADAFDQTLRVEKADGVSRVEASWLTAV
jgi:DNA repair protein SbcC/Rad50